MKPIKGKCFAVIDIHGCIIDKSATLERAKDRKWELENEHPDYLGQKLIILETTWQ